MALPGLLAPAREPSFRFLWGGQAFALLAAEFHLIALGWLAYELTGSGLALSTVLIAGMVPQIIFTLLGGVAADRVPFKRVLLSGNLVRASVVGGFALLVTTGLVVVWQLYVVAATLGAITSFYLPAYYAAVPRVAEPDKLRQSHALLRGTAEFLGLVGPLAAGAVITLFGTGRAFWVTAVSYAVAAIALAGVRPRPEHVADQVDEAAEDAAKPSVLEQVREGFAALREDAFVRHLIVLIALASLALSGPIGVGVLWLANERFMVEAAAYGLIMSMWTGGALVGAALVGSLRGQPPWRQLIGGVMAVLGAGLVVLGFAPGVPVAAGAMFVMGVSAGSVNILLVTRLQESTEDRVLGRVMSFVELSEVLSTPLSFLAVGILIDVADAAVFVAAGALLLGVSIWTFLARRRWQAVA